MKWLLTLVGKVVMWIVIGVVVLVLLCTMTESPSSNSMADCTSYVADGMGNVELDCP